LAFERRPVGGPLAADDEVCAARERVEADGVEDELGAVDQLRAERGEPGAEPAAGAGAAQVAERRERGVGGEAALELLDLRRAGAFLRPERAGGAAVAEQRVADVAGHADADRREPVADDGAQPRAAVDGRGAADADE